jgi:hypothetical protein
MKNVAVDRGLCLAKQPLHVVTCEHASSASLSTHLQLTSGDTESEELGRYGAAPGDAGTGHFGTNDALRSVACA